MKISQTDAELKNKFDNTNAERIEIPPGIVKTQKVIKCEL